MSEIFWSIRNILRADCFYFSFLRIPFFGLDFFSLVKVGLKSAPGGFFFFFFCLRDVPSEMVDSVLNMPRFLNMPIF